MPTLLETIQSRAIALRAGARIGARTQIHYRAILDREGGEIILGRNCKIHCNAQLLAGGGRIEIGDDCSVNPGCVLYGHGGLKIGHGVRIAALTVIIPGNHIFKDPARPIKDQGVSLKGITIGNDVWIGAQVTVLDGVNIADGCVIGANSVVTKSTEPLGVYVGNPAKFLKRRGD